MVRKYALLNNNVISKIIECEDSSLQGLSSGNDLTIDITDMQPQPFVGWVLSGNKLEIPQGLSDRETFEEKLNDLKSTFGAALSRKCTNKIGARNKILNKSGEQVVTLLNTLLGVRFLLEGGALGTARYSCSQLKLAYTEYADIFDYVINEINKFEQSNGL